MKDASQLDVTTGRGETVAALNRYADDQFNIRHAGASEQEILQAAKEDPDCVLVNAYAALIKLQAGEGDTAAAYLQAARTHAAMATERENLFLAAIEAWAEGDFTSAVAAHEKIANLYPLDFLSAQLCCRHKFYVHRDVAGALRVMQAVVEANADSPQAIAFLSFMLEEAGDFEAAEARGREAVALDRGVVFGQHTVAHVMEAEGRFREGIEWLEQFPDTWDDLNPSFLPHMWMHLSIFYLGVGDFDRVLDIHDNHVLAHYGEAPPAQLYAANALARAELEGADVGNRWQDLAARIAAPPYRHIDALSDVHKAWVLARGGTGADAFIDSLAAHAAGLHESIRQTWQQVALPTAMGLAAFAREEYQGAVDHLRPIEGRFPEIGGSNVERAVFSGVWLEALLRAGHHAEAKVILEARVAQKGDETYALQRLDAL